MSRKYSPYFYELEDEAQRRYVQKLEKLGGVDDPYLQEPSVVGEDWKGWPSVEYPDIYNYLIQTPSLYTGESLKAYKSLEAYNYYVNGWIDNVKVTKMTEPHYMVTAAVRHSQKLTVPPAKPWVAVKHNGSVVCAHCSCMSGLGEACSHIAALLFALEATTAMNKSTTCTSLPCSWLPPTFQNVPYAELSDIDFSTPQAKRKKVETEVCVSTSSGSSKVACATEDEVDTFLKDLSKAGKAVILSVTPGFSDSFVPMCMRGIIPQPLADLYDPAYLQLSYPQVLDQCETVFENYVITADMAANVEKHTRNQSQSKLWFQQRAGRVTASKLKAAVCTSLSQPSISLIKSVCYPECNRFASKATAWGCVHERTALEAYVSQERSKHTKFDTWISGLVIHPSYPLMGASPDSFVECECCGKGVIEVKCPYSCKQESVNKKAAEDSRFFLKEDLSGHLHLDVYHAHYFQVQAQLKFCCASYADFVVWTEKQLFIQRIYPDEPFITSVLKLCNTFIKTGILPEVIGKYYSKDPVLNITSLDQDQDNKDPETDQDELLWCYCRQPECEGQEMIACDDNTCRIQWFHISCLRLKKVPKGKWFCPDCRKLKSKTKK